MSSNNEDEEEFIDTSHEDVYFGMRIIDEIIGSSPTGVGGLYLGRVHFLQRHEEFKVKGIGAVLSIIGSDLPTLSECVKSHIQIRIDDSSDENLMNRFDDISSFIKKNLQTTNVFVHCQMGISRSATAVCAFLLREGIFSSVDEALEFLRTKRDLVKPNEGFYDQLVKYENILKNSKKVEN